MKRDFDSGTGDGVLKPDDYRDFATKSEVSLDVNYDYPGYKALIEVYGEDPMVRVGGEYVKKEGVEPLFKTYTDNDARFRGKMSIPGAYKEVYLYTRGMGLPRSVKLDVENGGVKFDLSEAEVVQAELVTRAGNGKGDLVAIDEAKKLYSLCSWGDQGKLTGEYMKHITHVTPGGEKISDLVQRLQWALWDKSQEKPYGLDNSKYLSGPEKTNVSIARKAADGSVITGATVDVVFLHEGAWFTNSLGYYYYDSSEKNPDVTGLNKFIIIPNVSLKGHYPYDSGKKFNKGPLASGDKVRLQYCGPEGKDEPTDVFPAGYTIGWFIISEGYDMETNRINPDANYLYSNNDACITLYDKQTNRLVVGFEDGDSDKSYEDVLFYVEADPMKAVVDPENPGLPSIDGDDVDVPDETESVSGTLAFEDIWPWHGDYDLNDVVIEYRREIVFDKDNMVKKIIETYVPVHDGAKYTNGFATMFDGDMGGTLTLPQGAVRESATGAVVLFPDMKLAMGQTCVLERDFGDGTFKKETMPRWNPFIIVGYGGQEQQNRTEVHLPKHKPTALVNMDLVSGGEDAFYIYKDGKHPFALDLPIPGWQVPQEMVKIDDAYPRYVKWVNDGSDADWYNYPDPDKVIVNKE